MNREQDEWSFERNGPRFRGRFSDNASAFIGSASIFAKYSDANGFSASCSAAIIRQNANTRPLRE